MNRHLAVGDVVRFSRIWEEGDDLLRFRVLELRGVRVLVESVGQPFDAMTIRPTEVHLVVDLERVGPSLGGSQHSQQEA